MATNKVNEAAEALRRADPRLTRAEALAMIQELLQLVDRGKKARWDLTVIGLQPRNTPKTSPLGNALRQLRLRAGFTQAEAGKEAGWSSAKVMRMENGQVAVDKADLSFLIRLYRVTDRATLETLAKLAGVPRII